MLSCLAAGCLMYFVDGLQVLEWCPKNNLVRKVLGSIKVATLLHDATSAPCCARY